MFRNKKYGIGGQSALIFVNILDGIITTLKGNQMLDLLIPVGISIVVMMIVVFMENSEFRIPVQRISIHNIYADNFKPRMFCLNTAEFIKSENGIDKLVINGPISCD